MPDTVRYIVHILCYIIITDNFCCSLKQTAMQVEYVTRISLTTRRTAKQQGNLTVSHRLFCKIIINDQCRTTGITEKLTDSSAGKRSVELQRSRIRSRCCNNSSVFHCTSIL